MVSPNVVEMIEVTMNDGRRFVSARTGSVSEVVDRLERMSGLKRPRVSADGSIHEQRVLAAAF